MDPQMEGIFDNYSVKRQIINSGYVIALYIHLPHLSFIISYYWRVCFHFHGKSTMEHGVCIWLVRFFISKAE